MSHAHATRVPPEPISVLPGRHLALLVLQGAPWGAGTRPPSPCHAPGRLPPPSSPAAGFPVLHNSGTMPGQKRSIGDLVAGNPSAAPVGGLKQAAARWRWERAVSRHQPPGVVALVHSQFAGVRGVSKAQTGGGVGWGWGGGALPTWRDASASLLSAVARAQFPTVMVWAPLSTPYLLSATKAQQTDPRHAPAPAPLVLRCSSRTAATCCGKRSSGGRAVPTTWALTSWRRRQRLRATWQH